MSPIYGRLMSPSTLCVRLIKTPTATAAVKTWRCIVIHSQVFAYCISYVQVFFLPALPVFVLKI